METTQNGAGAEAPNARIMELYAEGKSRRDIAQQMGLETRTVNGIILQQRMKAGEFSITRRSKPRRRKTFLTDEQKQEIYSLIDKGWNNVRIAKRYHTSQSSISRLNAQRHKRGGAPKNASPSPIAERIKSELLDRLVDCQTISDIKAAISDFGRFLE